MQKNVFLKREKRKYLFDLLLVFALLAIALFAFGIKELLSEDGIWDAVEEVARGLCEFVSLVGASPERILAVGLGNRNLSPDSIGPKTADIIRPTLHVKNVDEEFFDELDCSEIAVLCPGVMAQSGMESYEIIKAVCHRISPTLLIAIDSIATSSYERLGSTVQLSHTGLFPGSGVGNFRTRLTEDTLGVPIISVGVPTVIDARAFGLRESMLVVPKDIDEITTVAAKIIGNAVNQAFGISPF